MGRNLSKLMVAIVLIATSFASQADGVILQYHHVSTSTPKVTSVTPAQLTEHLSLLESLNIEVLPLPEFLQKAMNGDRSTRYAAITFDDGYRNILENGHPILQEYEFPYTIFINPEQIGQRRDQLTWGEVKQLSDDGVLFANHTLNHQHLLQRKRGETRQQWLQRIREDITRADAIIAEKLGSSPKYLAYPYGEYNRDVQTLLRELDYVGFAQHSGAVGAGTELTAVPRYPAAGVYANPTTLKTKLLSLAMPVIDSDLTEPEITSAQLPDIRLTVNSDDLHQHLVACYYNGDKVPVEINQGWQISLSEYPAPVGRSRINCTAPSRSQPGRYYWFSQAFFKADNNGQWRE